MWVGAERQKFPIGVTNEREGGATGVGLELIPNLQTKNRKKTQHMFALLWIGLQ